MLKPYLEKISAGESLSREEAAEALEQIIRGEVSATEIGGLLIGLRVKGESVSELLGFVDTMKRHMVRVELDDADAIDLCGTGGDCSHSFNVSTTAAIIVAAGGVTVAKHGNRSVSSKAGSADVLQALGVRVDLTPEQVKQCVEETGFGFFYAPLYHPAMKQVAEHRRNLGMRTVFNMLGPLLNPAEVKRQLIGAYDVTTAKILAHVLREKGCCKACTVHSEDGFDEVSPFAENRVFELSADDLRVREYTFRASVGSNGSRNAVKGNGAMENARITREVLAGHKGPARDMGVLNAAFGFYVAGATNSVDEGVGLAEETIDSGKAMKKLLEIIECTNQWN